MRVASSVVLILSMLSFSSVSAEGWEKAADLSLTFNQSSYSNSWAGGESGTITWMFTGNYLAARNLKTDMNWRNEIKLQFGQTHSQSQDSSGKKTWNSPEVSSDRIYFESLLKLVRPSFMDPFVSLTFESRFYDATVPELPRYLNPMTLTETVGLAKTLKKSEETELISRLGFALRQRLTKDIVSIDPDETEVNSTNYGGLEWVTDYSHSFDERMKFVSKARIFQAIFSSESSDLEGLPNEDYWKATDVAWENTLSANFSELIQVSLFLELIYDKEIDLRGQFRELLGIGLAYKLF